MKKIIALCIMALMAVPTAFAEGGYEVAYTPYYLGLGLGRTDNKTEKIDGQDFSDNVEDDTDMIKKIYGGYRFNERFSIEAFYIDLGTVDLESDSGTSSIKLNALGVNLLWYNAFKAAPRARFFLKAGINRSRSEVDDISESTSGLNVGFGMDYSISDHFSLRGEYVQLQIVEGDASVFALSVMVDF